MTRVSNAVYIYIAICWSQQHTQKHCCFGSVVSGSNTELPRIAYTAMTRPTRPSNEHEHEHDDHDDDRELLTSGSLEPGDDDIWFDDEESHLYEIDGHVNENGHLSQGQFGQRTDDQPSDSDSDSSDNDGTDTADSADEDDDLTRFMNYSDEAYGWQSLPGYGSSYASAVYWDDRSQTLLITGNTYGTFPSEVGVGVSQSDGDAGDDDVHSRRMRTSSRTLSVNVNVNGGHIGKTGEQLLPTDCFVAQLSIQTSADEESLPFTRSNSPLLQWSRQLGYADTNEYCNAITTAAVNVNVDVDVGQSQSASGGYTEPAEQFEIMVVGYTSPTGLLTDLILPDGELEEGDADTVLGMSLTLSYTADTDVNVDVDADSSTTATTTSPNDGYYRHHNALSGTLFYQNAKSYPVAVSTFRNGDLCVAMLITDDPSHPYDPQSEMQTNAALDLTTSSSSSSAPGKKPFQIQLLRLKRRVQQRDSTGSATGTVEFTNGEYVYHDAEKSHSTVWTKYFGTEDSMDVRITDLKIVVLSGEEEMVVLAGTTAGHGRAFGLRADDDGDSTNEDNLDGFVTKLSGSNGQFWEHTADPTQIPVHTPNQAYTTRIRSQREYTDEVEGICIHESDNALYVVGSTTSSTTKSNTDNSLTYRAFLQKLNLDSLQTVWTRQIGDTTNLATSTNGISERRNVFGVGCVVNTQFNTVYVAGTTNGGLVSPTLTKPYGGDDVFVASYQTATGNVNFVTQLGSDQNDVLARGGGDCIAVDPNTGSAILVGSTDGSFMRDTTINTAAADTENGDVHNQRESAVFVVEITPDGRHKMPHSVNYNQKSNVDPTQERNVMFQIALILFVTLSLLALSVLLYERRQKKRQKTIALHEHYLRNINVHSQDEMEYSDDDATANQIEQAQERSLNATLSEAISGAHKSVLERVQTVNNVVRHGLFGHNTSQGAGTCTDVNALPMEEEGTTHWVRNHTEELVESDDMYEDGFNDASLLTDETDDDDNLSTGHFSIDGDDDDDVISEHPDDFLNDEEDYNVVMGSATSGLPFHNDHTNEGIL
mmetsp:Transcript_19643/g.24048  ORF Transcript_19643/g.24048 Transcript_19643/m.24048 type:complete len:1048 (-) Transcript_19643:1516-4659(-)